MSEIPLADSSQDEMTPQAVEMYDPPHQEIFDHHFKTILPVLSHPNMPLEIFKNSDNIARSYAQRTVENALSAENEFSQMASKILHTEQSILSRNNWELYDTSEDVEHYQNWIKNRVISHTEPIASVSKVSLDLANFTPRMFTKTHKTGSESKKESLDTEDLFHMFEEYLDELNFLPDKTNKDILTKTTIKQDRKRHIVLNHPNLPISIGFHNSNYPRNGQHIEFKYNRILTDFNVLQDDSQNTNP